MIYENSKYSVNWADLEEKLATPSVRMMVFCNPHNPIGYAWSEEEVKRIAELCAKHQVLLISDEIHGDLVLTDEDITPAFTVDWDAKNWVVSLISPSKTFNLAALHAACAIIPNQDLRARAEESFFLAGIGEPNLFWLSRQLFPLMKKAMTGSVSSSKCCGTTLLMPGNFWQKKCRK
ncbi:aminotransferase class I/II-fold pyridoxal phosphate-dependent enzyme [Lactobacillus delbrueckii subsp. bulgaricus]